MRELFDEIIRQDRVFGHLLEKIKIEYDIQSYSANGSEDERCACNPWSFLFVSVLVSDLF